MRVGRVLSCYEIVAHTDLPQAFIAELRHVVENRVGGSVRTAVGWIAAAPIPPEPEASAYWRVTVTLRTDVAAELRDSRLPEALADWLLAETACEEPMVLSVYEGINSAFVQRGEIWDD